MAKFRLTFLFILFSLGIATLTVFILNRVSSDVGERSLISVATKLAETDAQLVGGALEAMGTAEVTDGDEIVTVSELIAAFNAGDPLAVLLTFLGPEVLEPLNVVNISLVGDDGTEYLALGSEMVGGIAAGRAEYMSASLAGEMVSVLERDFEYVNDEGATMMGDVVTTFVPLQSETDSGTFVMTLTRDMSAELIEEIATTRAALFQVAIASIGGLFVVLLVFIVWADLRIWRGHKRLLDEQLILAESERDRQELATLNRSKDQFISTVSHELKTPLTTIMGYSEIMRRNRSGSLDERQLKYLETMRDAGRRLDLLIDDMLDISRIESGKLSLDQAPFEVSGFLRNAVDSLKPLVSQRQQKLVLQSDHKLVNIDGDEARLAQCVSNLVTNASKYSPEGTSITVVSELSGNDVVISVVDQGIGISPDDQANLFSMFFRAENQQTRSQPGVGLGLFITSAIVDSHGGDISVESEPDNGTTVRVVLRNAVPVTQISTEEAPRSRPVGSRLEMLNSA